MELTSLPVVNKTDQIITNMATMAFAEEEEEEEET